MPEEPLPPVCDECKSIEQQVRLCTKCGIAFCLHYSSPTDQRYCRDCMLDFGVVTQTEVRITEHVSRHGEVTYQKRDICKSLKLQGTDWLFAARRIHTLTDEELNATVEYHRAICGLMLNEREERKTERFQKLQKVVIKLQNRTDLDSAGAIKASKPLKDKKVKTKLSADDTNAALATALKVMMDNGISADQLTTFLLQAAGKKK